MTYVAENGIELTDELLDAMAAEYESGDWSGVGKVSPGRPRAYGEEMATVSFRIPRSRVVAIEEVARKRGETKSDFFRNAIDQMLVSMS